MDVLKNLPVPLVTIGLLVISNLFMTFAWYGHLRITKAHLGVIILVSWGLAFFEYCFQVPANRIGYGYYNAVELKTIQEVISLTIFVIFSALYLNQPLKWNYFVGFGLIVLATYVIFKKW